MDAFRLNQIALVFLATVFVLFSASLVSEALFHTDVPETPGYAIVVEEDGDTEVAAVEEGPAFEPVEPLLASADLGAGESVFRKCASCHTWEEGGANKVGPNLWNIVGRPVASVEGFNYSAALTEWGEGKVWTFEDLNGFFWKPKTYVSGTSMGFGGLSKVDERANLIGWLRTHSPDPVPLPGS